MNDNIFRTFLKLLKVRHTKWYASKLFHEHPHKYDLFGLSVMLSSYRIENAGLRLDNKEEVVSLEVPFIAHLANNFVIVCKITPQQVEYLWNGEKITVSNEEFMKIWSGIVLVAEADETSIEPEYRKHRKTEIINRLRNVVLGVMGGVFVFYEIYGKSYSLGALLLLLASLTGIAIGIMLVQKQIHIQSKYGDKICSLFKQGNCNSVLESDAAKLFGIVGWSEIGLSYFLSNFFLVLAFPGLIPYLALLNIGSLPFSAWSIWYQKIKARQWCPLCLLALVLLWTTFVLTLSFGYLRIPEIGWYELGLVAVIYITPLVIINKLIPVLAERNKAEQIVQEMNSIKANEAVFETLLKQQPRFPVTREVSGILLGNTDAPMLVTILTNPHCNPCAKMHERVSELLKYTEHICVQYVFTAFRKELEVSNRFLIAAYLQKDKEERERIYTEWFEKGKYKKETFFLENKINWSEGEIEKEFERHESWKKLTRQRSTPTVLVNGYKLPDNYQIEDLKNITLEIHE